MSHSADVYIAESLPPSEKRRLLDFVVSNSTWKDGELLETYRHPFDMLAVTTSASNEKKVAGGDSDDLRQVWLPKLVSNRALLPHSKSRRTNSIA